MTISTIEGIVENGQIRLLEDITLPENAKVFVIVPVSSSPLPAKIASPRLVHAEQARDFTKQVFDAGV